MSPLQLQAPPILLMRTWIHHPHVLSRNSSSNSHLEHNAPGRRMTITLHLHLLSLPLLEVLLHVSSCYSLQHFTLHPLQQLNAHLTQLKTILQLKAHLQQRLMCMEAGVSGLVSKLLATTLTRQSNHAMKLCNTTVKTCITFIVTLFKTGLTSLSSLTHLHNWIHHCIPLPSGRGLGTRLTIDLHNTPTDAPTNNYLSGM